MWLKKLGKGILLLFLSLTMFCMIVGIFGVIGVGLWAKNDLDIALDERLFQSGEDRTTRLYYYNEAGEAIELSSDRISGYENALYCPLCDMSEHLPNAFIAIEDKRFWQHGGIDWLRTASAVLNYTKKETATLADLPSRSSLSKT